MPHIEIDGETFYTPSEEEAAAQHEAFERTNDLHDEGAYRSDEGYFLPKFWHTEW